MSDLRAPITAALEAFGVPATVTRPAPDNAPVSTTGVWGLPLLDDLPFGKDLQRVEPRRVLSLPRTDLPTLPRGSLVLAPEAIGDVDRLWRVDGFERVEWDCWRAIVIAVD